MVREDSTSIVDATLTPPLCSLEDPVYALHRSFVATTFLYSDLRQAIRFENRPHNYYSLVEDVACPIPGYWQEELFNRGSSSDLQCTGRLSKAYCLYSRP